MERTLIDSKKADKMEINKEIKLTKVKNRETFTGSKIFEWTYKEWCFEYVDGDSRFDVMYPSKKWESKKIYGKKTRSGAMEAIKQFLTLEALK